MGFITGLAQGFVGGLVNQQEQNADQNERMRQEQWQMYTNTLLPRYLDQKQKADDMNRQADAMSPEFQGDRNLSLAYLQQGGRADDANAKAAFASRFQPKDPSQAPTGQQTQMALGGTPGAPTASLSPTASDASTQAPGMPPAMPATQAAPNAPTTSSAAPGAPGDGTSSPGIWDAIMGKKEPGRIKDQNLDRLASATGMDKGTLQKIGSLDYNPMNDVGKPDLSKYNYIQSDPHNDKFIESLEDPKNFQDGHYGDAMKAFNQYWKDRDINKFTEATKGIMMSPSGMEVLKNGLATNLATLHEDRADRRAQLDRDATDTRQKNVDDKQMLANVKYGIGEVDKTWKNMGIMLDDPAHPGETLFKGDAKQRELYERHKELTSQMIRGGEAPEIAAIRASRSVFGGGSNQNTQQPGQSDIPTAPSALKPTQNKFGATETKYGIPSGLMSTVAKIENAPGDTSAVSDAGAIGLFQITPDTAKTYGVDPSKLTNGKVNEDTAGKILQDLLKKFNNNPQVALAAYNAGPNNAGVQKFAATGDRSGLPEETQNYLTKAFPQQQAKNSTVQEPNGVTNQVVTISGPDDMAKLAPGTKFMFNGKHYTKA